MLRLRIATVVAASAALALALTGCSGASSSGDDSSAATAKGGTLSILTTASPVHLDPATSQNLSTTTLGLIVRRLTTWQIQPGKAAKVVPDLATNTGTPSDGGKTWTYHLKSGVEFQDGTAITTKDIKYGIERSFAPTLTGGLSYHKSLLVGGDSYQGPFDGKQLDSIETPDASTIVFHLNAAYGDWPWIASMPAFAPVPEGKGDPNTYDKDPVSSGPYQVQSNQQGSQLTLVRNEHWSAKTDAVRTAGPAKIVFKEGQDSSTVTQTLIADSGDAKDSFSATYLGAAELNQVRQNPSAADRVATSKAGPLSYLAMNTQKGALADLKVRQAIEYATDKRAFRIASGGALAGTYASTLITPGIAGRKSYDLYDAPASGNVKKAESLLEDAGHADDLSLTLLTQNDPSYLAQAQAIQQGLKRAGITVTLKPEDADSFYTDATNDDSYDLVLYSWQPDFPSANANIQPLFASSQIGSGGNNVSHYSNADVDSLIAKATATVDTSDAQALWAQVDKRIMQDAPVVPLTYAKQSFLHGSNVENFRIADFPAYPNYLKVSLAK
ncbi:ABC transporter substrate-binding protein [Curtobacterium sp. Leaf261]|uniref:ABC transporter substrate-binding protein n=1 Tax=Curtobacterium sp. Leaf261 TaxID=1736311 RepID=UPI0006FFB195|nr:ABC transporter substrate-binding protein [Curtobacterium sp. Leaf261]KQO62305.1 ABC transporter substrate-binding protein [Curtobacterium sp. Leaf261]